MKIQKLRLGVKILTAKNAKYVSHILKIDKMNRLLLAVWFRSNVPHVFLIIDLWFLLELNR